MATRAGIWQKQSDGWRGVYLHWDGYPEHAGKTLAECYNTEEKVDALLEPVFNDSKYLSELAETPAECVYKDDSNGNDSYTGVSSHEECLAKSRKWTCEYMYDWDGVWQASDLLDGKAWRMKPSA